MKSETKVQQSRHLVTSLEKPNAYFETLYEAARYARDVENSTVYSPKRNTAFASRTILAYSMNGLVHVTMEATVNEAATIRDVPRGG
jgi:hypothetical protein